MKNQQTRSEERAWKEYLFQGHSEQFLVSWAKRLRYFRFVRAHGGHGSSPDKILLSLRYEGEKDLVRLLDILNIPRLKFNEKPPQPEPHKQYSGQEFRKFPSLVPGTEWIAQPAHQVVNNIEVFIWCHADTIQFRISGLLQKQWDLTETEFKNAEELESLFENQAERMVDPPEDTKYCLCPKYYPEYWSAG